MADVGGIINRLAPLIEKTVKNEYNLLINAKTEATNLYFNLEEIQKVLEEAERRRSADPRVKTWLEKLQDVMYEIDDALDEWETLDLQLQFEGSDEDDVSHAWLKKVSIFIESLCSRPKRIFRHRGMALKIRDLNEKVDLLGKEKAKYALLPINSDSQDVKCEITTSFSDLIEIPSQQADKKKLVKLLTCKNKEPGDIQVISVVGIVGVGKTSLAQLAFNDPKVQSRFELKSWICASHIFDMVGLTKAIVQSLSVNVSYPEDAELQTLLEFIQRSEDAELQTLLEFIQRSISGRKFFLVLDHVRMEDDSIWNQLKASLRHGAPGSRIVVTSRNENVPNLVDSTEIMKVRPLKKEDCWLLFSGIALRGRKDKEQLRGIGQRIAKKCGGLPLAAKTLGHYLQSKYRKELWDDVLEKELWQLDEVAKALFTTLAVSYNELPLALKHCFSSWATFDKGLKISVDKLMRIWMVQGYTETELTGLGYFEKLAGGSFFQKGAKRRSGGDNSQTCKMHRILHDFARYLKKTGSKVAERRIFYSNKLLSSSELGSMKSVRLLTTTYKGTKHLPPEIGNLVHLRYLDLSGTQISELPKTICNLYKLQVLGLLECSELHELPKKIHRLRNLRHLLTAGSRLLRLPQGVEKLTNLQTLDKLYVGNQQTKFGYLAKLNQLRGSVNIIIMGNLNEEKDVEDARKADLRSKKYISDLQLDFEGEVSMEVMEALQAPPNLQSFGICGYRGTLFPEWIGTSLCQLRELQFSKFANCLELPPLGGLPFLERLTVQGMESLKYVGYDHESKVAASKREIFPKLRILEFGDCDSLEQWEDITEDEAKKLSIMPCLEELMIRGCKKLKALPNLLLHNATSLKPLTIYNNSHLRSLYQPGSRAWEFIFQNKQS